MQFLKDYGGQILLLVLTNAFSWGIAWWTWRRRRKDKLHDDVATHLRGTQDALAALNTAAVIRRRSEQDSNPLARRQGRRSEEHGDTALTQLWGQLDAGLQKAKAVTLRRSALAFRDIALAYASGDVETSADDYLKAYDGLVEDLMEHLSRETSPRNA